MKLIKRLLFCFVISGVGSFTNCSKNVNGEINSENITCLNENGQIQLRKIYSNYLLNNIGENPIRNVTIYLPPNYHQKDKRYPVIYFLHGFTSSDADEMKVGKWNDLLDQAILNKKIKPIILVLPNQHTQYQGSWYTNSDLTGLWADFTSKELVNFIDDNFRTLAKRESRGLAGHSMGGFGAIKLGMLYPEVFSTIYALSPAFLGLEKEIGPDAKIFKKINEITTKKELFNGYNFLESGIISAARAFSPNLKKPPFYVDLPYEYTNDCIVAKKDIITLWQDNLPIYMIDDHLENLKSLKALKLDWGRNDGLTHIPFTSKMFSKKLERFEIQHFAEEYIGGHNDKIYSADGRVVNELIPFFDMYLEFK
ncbi:MAG: esterase [Flammeovirgaceae bacterium]|nr:esterase [Flammeovirgaceae bacterium]